MKSKGDKTGKELEITAKEKKILGYVMDGLPHGDIAKRCNIGLRTLYRHLKDIKDKCGLVPAEIIASMALEMVRQLKVKLEMAFKDLLSSWNEWEAFKEKMKKKRTKAEQKKWDDLSINEQIAVEEAQTDKLKRLENSYTRSQMAHSYAMKDIIHFKKAIGVYAPDINLTDNSVNQTNIINTDWKNALKEANDDYGEEALKLTEARIREGRLRNQELEMEIIDVKSTEIKEEKTKGGKKNGK